MHPGIADGFRSHGKSEHDALIAGEFPRVSHYVTVTGEGSLMAGSVLGMDDTNGQHQLSNANATDGSQVPDAILAEDIDLTQGPSVARIYMSGEFSSLALHFGEGHSVSTVRGQLRSRSIFLHDQLIDVSSA